MLPLAVKPSPLAPVPAALKFVALALYATALFAVEAPWIMGLAAAAGLVLCLLAAVDLWAWTRRLWPLWLMLALLFAAQVYLSGVDTATVLVLRILALMAAGIAVSASTAFSDVVAFFTTLLAPLRIFGIDSTRLALSMSLSLRFIAITTDIWSELGEASRARGRANRGVFLIVPLICRALDSAAKVAEAVDARGYGLRSES